MENKKPLRVAIIGCSKQKRDGRRKVRYLYCSNRFKLNLAFALKEYDRVYAISAKHGLLNLDQTIESYNLALDTLTERGQRRWALKVASQIRKNIPEDASIDFYCSKEYRDPLEGMLNGREISAPLAHLRRGEQIAWFKKHLNS